MNTLTLEMEVQELIDRVTILEQSQCRVLKQQESILMKQDRILEKQDMI